MTRRQKIAIAAVVILLIALLASAIFLLTRPKAAAEPPVNPVEPALEAPEPETEALAPPPQVSALNGGAVSQEPQAPPGHLQVAELFAERYGSYSNQEAYANLRDLLPVMTAAFRARAEAQIDAAAGQPPAANYEGVTSLKLTTRQVAYDASAGTATVDVGLQQTKSVGTAAPTVAYRTLRLELEKIGEQWLVDAAAWRD